jgi:hypothetical protein
MDKIMDTLRSELHAIFGAGALGMAITHQLIANGKQVRMVNRSNKGELPPGVELIIGNAADRFFTQEVCKGAQVVYHCANPRYHFKTWLEEFPPKMSGMGKLMMQIGGLFIPEAAESVEMMYQFEHPFIVDSSKFIKAFGDISTPHQTAIRNTIGWYRQYLNVSTPKITT